LIEHGLRSAPTDNEATRPTFVKFLTSRPKARSASRP